MAEAKRKQSSKRKKKKEKQCNRKYKDSLFRIIFHDRKDLLELYNAVNGTDYKKEEDLEITTLDGAIGVKVKNDISFLIGTTMNLYEHQSTKNPNMPLRGVFYLSTLYQEYMNENWPDIYGSRQIKLPFPQYIVFYNGTSEEADRSELYLRDAFLGPADGRAPCIDCTAVMLNINYGHNRELMERCEALQGYAFFVENVRSCLAKGMELDTAVEVTIEMCMKQGILSGILKKYRREVKRTMILEYDEELHRIYEEKYHQEELEKAKAKVEKEALEKGLSQGISQGISQGYAEAVLELLSEKGAVSKELREQILEEKDVEVLKKYLKTAGGVDTVEEFAKNRL